MEFKIENTQVFGIEKAIVASGNSYRTTIRNENELNEKDIARAEKLGQVDPGTGHDTFLNACLVTMDITAPLYWWKQAQRYHWLEFVSSQSTMHCVLKFDLKNQCVDNVDEKIIDNAKDIWTTDFWRASLGDSYKSKASSSAKGVKKKKSYPLISYLKHIL